MSKINKLQLVEQLAANLGITISDCERFLNGLITFIYSSLNQGHTVNISGFGQFSISHRAPRIGVNPRKPTERITIQELNVFKFKAGEAAKEAIKLRK